MLLGTLSVLDDVLPAVPPHLSLPVCVMYFWRNNSKPKPNLPLVQAMLLGLVYGELSWRTVHPDGIFDSFFTQHLCFRVKQFLYVYI